MRRPDNLSRTALAELRTVLRDSRDYGPDSARRLQTEFLSIFQAVAEGRGLGHVRSDVLVGPNVRFRNVRGTLFVVVYDQEKRLVLRIVHGRRDFRTLVLDEPE